MAEKVQLSIHPRNWPASFSYGRDKQNTCARKRRSTVQHAIDGISSHLERHPRDAMSGARLAKLKDMLKTMPADPQVRKAA